MNNEERIWQEIRKHRGEKNFIPAHELLDLLDGGLLSSGLQRKLDTHGIRRLIKRLQAKGYKIISSSKGFGIPSCRDEIIHCINIEVHQAVKCFANAKKLARLFGISMPPGAKQMRFKEAL